MNTVRFVKSFSKGQITIPKELRDALGIMNEFWLRLYIQDGKIIAEPIDQKAERGGYAKKLLTIKGEWFHPEEMIKNRAQIEKHLRKRAV